MHSDTQTLTAARAAFADSLRQYAADQITAAANDERPPVTEAEAARMEEPSHCHDTARRIVTAHELHALVSQPGASTQWPTAHSAWRLLLTQYGPYATLEDMRGCTVRIPARSMVECVRADQKYATDRGFPAPSAVETMREGIAEGLSNLGGGNGNRFRRRLGALNMGARKRCRNPKGWDVVDTSCPDCPPAPASTHHLTVA